MRFFLEKSKKYGTKKTTIEGNSFGSKTLSSAFSSVSVTHPNSKLTRRPIFWGRWLFFLCLFTVAVILGFMTYSLLSYSEYDLAYCIFTKVSERAIYAIEENNNRKRLGLVSLASAVAGVGKDYEQWPFVAVNNFEEITMDIIDTSKGCYISFGPLVTPEQAPDFEAFAYDYYESSREPEPFKNGTAVYDFGKGIYSTTETKEKYHDTDGTTSWGSPNNILIPKFQHAAGPSKSLMNNMHSSELLGSMMDEMWACAKNKAELGDDIKECTFMSDLMHNRTSWIQEAPKGPGAKMMQPIYPANNRSIMVGVLATSLVWSENFQGIYADDVNGIDIILQTPLQTVSYSVIDGNVTFIGEGDFHNTKYDTDVIELLITDPELFGNASIPYTVKIYPNDILFDMYSTKNPTIATVVAVFIMLFTTLMFTGYDCMVRREFHVKKELLKAKRHFMRYVSHEVRTPLNAVCMGLNLMQDEIRGETESDGAVIKKEKAAELLDLAQEVLNNAQSAACVLNDFLNFDKVQAGQLNLELSIIPIWDLIESTMAEFRLPAQKKKVSFEVIMENKNPEDASQKVMGDQIRLAQVLRNLASNAIKFTPEGKAITVRACWMKATVEESTEVQLENGDKVSMCQSGWLRVAVADEGAGMTEEQLKCVFDSGTQFNANKHQQGGGSGLGLYIAKGIIEQHNGTLTVTSKGLGKGTTFNALIPVFHDPENATEAVDKDESGKSVTTLLSPAISTQQVTEENPCSWLDDREQSFRILVVDDAPMNRKLLARLLTKRGHIVDTAENGLVACEKVKQLKEAGQCFDTILMDFQMPVMDGPTATHQIRQAGSDCFIVGLTGNIMPEDVAHFKEAGANSVLGKPFQIEVLENLWVEWGVTASDDDFVDDILQGGGRAISFDMEQQR